MPCSGCSTLHGVNPNLTKKTNYPSHFPWVIFLFQKDCELVLGTLGSYHIYLLAKTQLHPPCFSEDWLSEFYQIWHWWWNINKSISFHFELFPRKANNKVFQKPQKSYFGASLDLFCSNLDKNEFSFKRGLCQILNIPIIYHHVKNQKKIRSYSWEKR